MIATGRKTNGMDMTEGPIGLLLIRYAAVSYTHLDVYKRQIYGWLSF